MTFALQTACMDGRSGSAGRIWRYDSQVTSIAEPEIKERQPAVFSLFQNYPNPFNPETTLTYELPEATSVNISIYNLKGERIRALVQGMQAGGNHSTLWDGKDGSGKNVASGVYLARIEAGREVEVRKITR